MLYRTPYVMECLRNFQRIALFARGWTAIGTAKGYGVVLSGDRRSFPLIYAWMDERAWRVSGPTAFVPAFDRERALIIGDALSLAFATLAHVD